MKIGRLVATMGVAVMAAVFGAAVPAHAADTNIRVKSRAAGDCISSAGSSARASRAACSGTNTRWHYQPRGTSPSKKALVKLQHIANRGCLDTLGGGSGAVIYTHACNSGNNQLWEVHTVSSGGVTYTVFKSWGAYRGRNQHLCLYTWLSPRSQNLETCNSADSYQQWTRPGA